MHLKSFFYHLWDWDFTRFLEKEHNCNQKRAPDYSIFCILICSISAEDTRSRSEIIMRSEARCVSSGKCQLLRIWFHFFSPKSEANHSYSLQPISHWHNSAFCPIVMLKLCLGNSKGPLLNGKGSLCHLKFCASAPQTNANCSGSQFFKNYDRNSEYTDLNGSNMVLNTC